MALVVITIQDQPSGNVDVRLNNEPRITPGKVAFTDAEKLGATALNAIHEQIRDTGPKLIIAGADELPH